MPELGSYGSVGVPTGNRRHYPEIENLKFGIYDGTVAINVLRSWP